MTSLHIFFYVFLLYCIYCQLLHPLKAKKALTNCIKRVDGLDLKYTSKEYQVGKSRETRYIDIEYCT